MRIDELKKIAEENDYTCWTTGGDFYVFKRRMSMKFIKIKKTECNKIYFHNFDMCDEKDFNMIKACMDFSYTHPDYREEGKKFYLKHKWEKKQFTFKEIEEIKEKFDTDLADFELVEVEDED